MTTRTSIGGQAGRERLAIGLYCVGAGLVGLEGAVHLQQLVEIFHSVPRIGPLFALNAAACAVVMIGLVPRRTRALAAAAGVAVSLAALVGLYLSYTVGLFGWIEVGLRTPVLVAIVAEAGAAAAFAAALLADRAVHRRGTPVAG